MFKKNLLKRFAVIGTALIMSLSMVACSKEKEESTKSEAVQNTTESTTEEKTTEEETTEAVTQTEEDTEEQTTESYYEEDGKLTVKHVTVTLPEGFKFYQDMNGTIAYLSEAGDISFAIYVEDDNIYSTDQVTAAYLAQVKNVYGDQVTDTTKSYNGKTYTIMDIDDPNGQFCGQAAFFCEGTTLIYLEFVSTTNDESLFEQIMNSMSF